MTSVHVLMVEIIGKKLVIMTSSAILANSTTNYAVYFLNLAQKWAGRGIARLLKSIIST